MLYEEKYLATGTETTSFTIKDINETDTIPNGYYLVLGDNREESKDSRTFGLVKKSDIKGKAKYVVYPFSRFGKRK